MSDPALRAVTSLRNTLRGSTAARAFREFFDSNRGALFSYRDRFPQSAELRRLTDELATDPGSGRLVRETYQSAVTSRAVGNTNRVVNVLGKDVATDRAVRDALAGGRPTSAEVRTKAERIRKILDDHLKYLKASGLEIGTQKDFFPRQYDEHAIAADPTRFRRTVAAEYQKTGMTAVEADDAARAFYEQATGQGVTGWRPDAPMSNSTKSRVLPPSADAALADFMLTDPRDVLSRYFLRTTREAEFTRRFGKNGALAEEWFSRMRRDGIPEADVEQIRAHFASATGTLTRPGTTAASAVAGWIQTVGIVARLTGATISSLPEALAVGVRTGMPLRGVQALGDMFRSASRNADMAQARQVAEWYGIVGNHGPDMVMASQAGNDIGATQLQRRITDGMFKLNLLHQLTDKQRTVATKHGMLFVKQMADDVASGSPRQASAARLLAELGIDEPGARAMSAWLRGNPDMPTMAGETAPARNYRAAVTRFVNETIQNPEPIDKPMWSAHPVGRLAYGITSFMYGFTRNVIYRSIKQTNAALTPDNGLSAGDRVRLAGALPALAMLVAAQTGVSEARDALGNRVQRREQEPWIQTVANLDRAGLFGNLSPFVNMGLSARYQADPASRLAGPYISNVTGVIKSLLGTLPQSAGGPNSPRTNNAENTAARTVYSGVLAPAVVAALSVAPMPAPVRVAAGAAAIAATRPDAARTFANAVAGEPTVRARTPGGARNGLRSSGGISAGGGISGR